MSYVVAGPFEMIFMEEREIALAIFGNLVRMRANLSEKVTSMIRHCVFLRFRDDVRSSDQLTIYRDLETLCAKLPGALTIKSGRNVSPEEGMDKGFSEGFILDFADAAARDAYLVHPEHQEIAGRIVSSAVGGAEGVFVFDMEV